MRLRLRSRLDRRIAALALPATGSGLTVLAHHWVDAIWLGRTEDSAGALAALAVGGFAVWILGGFASLLATGTTALVGRYSGAGRLQAAAYCSGQSLLWAVLLGLLLAPAGGWGAPWVFRIAGSESAVAAEGVRYLEIYWGGAAALLTLRAAGAAYRGYGNTRTPFLVSLGGLAANAVLDPLLIFGWGPFPRLGVAGAAAATVLSMAASSCALWLFLRRVRGLLFRYPGEQELRLTPETLLSARRPFGLDPVMALRIARIGLPIAIAEIFFSAIYVALSRIVAEAGGKAAQAALGIGHRGEGFAFIVAMGYAAAAASLVSRYLGAAKPRSAERAAWRSVFHASLLCGAWGGFLFLASEPLASVFTSDEPARGYAALYFRVVAWSLIPQAMELVLEGAFGGAGMTLPPLLTSLILTALRIPLAYAAVTAFDSGVEGIWWVISLTTVARGAVLGFWFSLGRWKKATV